MSVLVAYDGSDPAQAALEHAVAQYPDEQIILLRVIEAADGSIDAGFELFQEKLKELRRETKRDLSTEVNEILSREDLDLQMEVVVGNPGREIVEFAEDHDVETIVIGNHGRQGVTRVLLGSVAEGVVRRAPCVVTVVR